MGCFSSAPEKENKEKVVVAHPEPVAVHDASHEGVKAEGGEKKEKDPKKEALKVAGVLYKKYKEGSKKKKEKGHGGKCLLFLFFGSGFLSAINVMCVARDRCVFGWWECFAS